MGGLVLFFVFSPVKAVRCFDCLAFRLETYGGWRCNFVWGRHTGCEAVAVCRHIACWVLDSR